MAQDFSTMPVPALQRGLAAGAFRARDLIEDVLARAEAAAPFNAFAIIDAPAARAAADASDKARAAGQAMGPLAGLPVSLKDLIATKGMRTAFGSRTLGHNVPKQDAAAAANLRAAGAILYGKTTTPEFGHKVLTDSPLHGITRNPWNPARSCGGSSGGAGVATALGLGPIAITTDGAGSSRLPAGCCGVYGLKPTLGRVPHETAPDAFNLTTNIGVMARHPEDMAAAMAVMSASHEDDAWSHAAAGQPFVPAQPEASVRGRRFLLIRSLNGTWLDPEVEAKLEEAVKHIRDMGGVVTSFDGAGIDWRLEPSRIALRVNQAARFETLLRERRADLDPSFARTVEDGLAIDAAALRRALFERTSFYRDMNRLFAQADYLLTPTFATTALPVEQDAFGQLVVDGREMGDLRTAWYSYTIPQNLSGHPAVVMPFGLSRAGLPISIQATGRWFAEADLIGLAQAMETKTQASAMLPPSFRHT